jgi:hypothetical protein
MSDQTAAALIFLAPLALPWGAFLVAEAFTITATIRAERRKP